ncbi:hypothetical protein EC174750_2458 [Escherichia coli 174750]|nr:hypothetical protein EC2865200_2660 [Escherichia coli 2865200]EMX02165.1 hypothetical protein EC174750_2458 [Escherichia coli 174750]KEL57324.1 hypothetical protein AB66_4000 [Escherichia coli 5-172-05_S1_C3]
MEVMCEATGLSQRRASRLTDGCIEYWRQVNNVLKLIEE